MKTSGLWIAMAMTTGAIAAPEPQMVWEGEVDGTVVLYARANRVDIEQKHGLPVQRQRSRFYERLPDSRQDVSLEVLEGRGRVHISQQPRLENNYTLGVTIEDRQGGSSFYSLAFYWEDRQSWRDGRLQPIDRDRSDDREQLQWSGRVDGEVVVRCRRNECEPEVRAGQPVQRARTRASRPLPERQVQVSLDDTDGRGDVRLIEQPNEGNDYTASVLVRDPDGGSSDYAFTLAWNRPSRGTPDSLFVRPGVRWSGRVDGKVRLVIVGRNLSAQTIAGAPVTGERTSFERALPERQTNDPQIRKLKGRGKVEIVEYPSRRNGFQLVIEISDDKGGADDYQVEAGW